MFMENIYFAFTVGFMLNKPLSLMLKMYKIEVVQEVILIRKLSFSYRQPLKELLELDAKQLKINFLDVKELSYKLFS